MAVQAVLGGELAWVADNDPGASAILARRFPSVPNHTDITAAAWPAIEPVNIVVGGFPCQPVSLAGKRLGEADERWIWPAVAGAVRDLRPGLVFLENVSALVVRGLAGVAADLAEIGYVGSWCCLRASDVGACHRRERVFILARPAEDADRATRRERRIAAPGQAARGWSRADTGRSGGVRALADSRGTRLEIGPVEPDRDERQAAERGSGDAPADAAGDGRVQMGAVPVVNGRGLAADRDRGPIADTAGQRYGDTGTEGQRGMGGAALASSPADPHGDGFAWLPECDGQPEFRQADHEQRRVAPLRCVLDWGIYAVAIRRQERIFGRPAPRPTEPGRTGERLSPRFVEWMMGLPEGWVTDVPGLSRNAQLKALGNGVVPQQAAMALRLLLERAQTAPLVADRGAA